MAFTLRFGPEREAAVESPAWESTASPVREPDASATSVASEPHGREELDLLDARPAQRAAIQVDVVDASGAPASGVALVCGIVSPSPSARFDARLRTWTDASGSARVELADLPPDLQPEALRLRAEILAAQACEVALDPQHAEDRIVLQLPPTGSVLLRAIDAQGRATTTPVRFGLWARAEGATRDIEPLPRWIDAVDGVAVLERVGIGLELRVMAVPGSGDARAERISASGPACQGEERPIDVPLAERWPTAFVRVLDEDGNALANALLDVELSWSRSSARPTWGADRSAVQVRTDEEGHARFALRGTVARGDARRLVLTSPGDIVRSAERDLSWDVPPGDEVDLGDVQLRPLEGATDAMAWASGTVTDVDGMPVGHATVLVSVTDADGASLPDRTAQVRVEPDGRFVVTGPPVAERLSVRAIAPGFLRSAGEVVAPGARDLSIRMRAAARWTGHLRLDGDVAPDDLVVVVITPEHRLRTIPTSERVVVEGLEPGPIDVEVRTRVGGWLVERSERLAIAAAAGAPGDVREDDLDLRGRLTPMRLRLSKPDGSTLERVLARVEPEGWPRADVWIREGRLDLLVPSAARSIALEPRGYPSISVEPRAGLQDLLCGPRLLATERSPAPAGARADR